MFFTVSPGLKYSICVERLSSVDHNMFVTMSPGQVSRLLQAARALHQPERGLHISPLAEPPPNHLVQLREFFSSEQDWSRSKAELQVSRCWLSWKKKLMFKLLQGQNYLPSCSAETLKSNKSSTSWNAIPMFLPYWKAPSTRALLTPARRALARQLKAIRLAVLLKDLVR